MNFEDLEQILAPPAPTQAAWCNFDHDWYLRAYPDVSSKIEDAGFAGVRQYYLDFGRALGHSPNMFFDESWYRLRYADVEDEVATGEYGSGYEHYCSLGYLNRSAHWLYDNAVYTLFSPDVSDHLLVEFDCVNFYDHYIKFGAHECRVAHLLFDPATFRDSVEGLGKQAADSPFADYLRRIWHDRKEVRTSIFFDPAWYLSQHKDAKTALRRGRYAGALHHYLAAPNAAARSPLPQFSEPYYRERYPDIVAAIRAGGIASGYDHFLRAGVFDLRSPSPDIDLHAYMQGNAAAEAEIAAGSCRNAFEYLLRHGPRVAPVPAPAAAKAPAPAEAPAPVLAASPTPASGQGRVDFLGFHTSSHGWFFCGWVTPEHPALEGRGHAIAYFEKGRVSGAALMAPYPREDLAGKGVGLLLFLEGPGRPLGNLLSLTVTGEGIVWMLLPSENTPMPRDAELTARLRPVLNITPASTSGGQIVALAARRGYTGENTLGELADRVLLEIDETIFCPPNGVVLVGWMLAAPGVLRSIRLYCASEAAMLQPEHFLRIARPDVAASVGAKFGLTEPRSGFMLYVANVYTPGEISYLAVETARGQVAFRGIPEPKLRGMEAIRFMLDRFDLRYDELVRCLDHVVGPAVASLNHDRLAEPTEREVIDFGHSPEAPDLSVIVPLYGRLDFMEYQFALFSRHQPGLAVEFIYVLDDPTLRREAEVLAASVFARFAIPFRLVLLSRNLGYAPANNIGVELARGRYVCLLNSDVMPDTDDWMERLVGRLEENPTIGAIGPLLLFEDRSVQHQGMVFEALAEFGNWLFPIHSRKGWRPPAEGGLLRAEAITGACLVIERKRLRELGGLDESFVIGDFEDSDLCMKLAGQGLRCAVDCDVTLYHLERQSQAGSEQRWRMNLTLYNAWVHEGRWGAQLRAAPPPAPQAAAQTPAAPRKARPAGKARQQA
jgi:GT2 family glycosyltransferase